MFIPLSYFSEFHGADNPDVEAAAHRSEFRLRFRFAFLPMAMQ